MGTYKCCDRRRSSISALVEGTLPRSVCYAYRRLLARRPPTSPVTQGDSDFEPGVAPADPAQNYSTAIAVRGSSRVARLELGGARTCVWPLPAPVPARPSAGGPAGARDLALSRRGYRECGGREARPTRDVPGRAGLAPGCRAHAHPTQHGAPCGLEINPVTQAPPRRLRGPGRAGDEPGPHPARAFAPPPARLAGTQPRWPVPAR